MTEIQKYDTVAQAVNDLISRGYTENLSLGENEIISSDKKISMGINNFAIDEVYRFEGDTDPADEAIVYGISSKKHNLKGVLVNGYGIYAETPPSNEIMAKLRTGEKEKNS